MRSAMANPTDPIPFRLRRLNVVDGSAAGSNGPAKPAAPLAPRPKAKPRGLPPAPGAPTEVQRAWLARGVSQAGGKLPLFDEAGRRIDARTIRSCIEQGWAEPWFANPLKPDWLVCRLTDSGRAVVSAD